MLYLEVPSLRHGITVFSQVTVKFLPSLYPVHISLLPISLLHTGSLHNYCTLCTWHQHQQKTLKFQSSVATQKIFWGPYFRFPSSHVPNSRESLFFCARPGNQNPSWWLRPPNIRYGTNVLYKEIPPNSKECIGILHKDCSKYNNSKTWKASEVKFTFSILTIFPILWWVNSFTTFLVFHMIFNYATLAHYLYFLFSIFTSFKSSSLMHFVSLKLIPQSMSSSSCLGASTEPRPKCRSNSFKLM